MTTTQTTTASGLVLPVLHFVVPGVPVGQAEVRPGNLTKSGKRTPSYYPNGKTLKPWRATVTEAAELAALLVNWRPILPPDGVDLHLAFWLPRPPSVKPRARPLPVVKPDVQHLVRAVEDALTAARVWKDDGQVVRSSQSKSYADDRAPGVAITIAPVPAREEYVA